MYPNAPAGLLFHGDPGIPEAYANTNWLGLAPRFGLAWDPTGKGTQSLRASFGIFFDSPESYTNRDWGLAAPWGSSVSLTAPAGGFANPYQGYPGGNPFPTAYPPTRNSTFPLSGLYVVNNRFGRHSAYQCPILLSTQASLSQNSGNVWDDSGSAIPAPQQHD